MTNRLETEYRDAFRRGLSLSEDIDVSLVEYDKIPEWDSVGHMTLIAEVEDTFDITFDVDDIIEFSSYTRGKELLTKYQIHLE